jgi:hypothetical protein
LNGTRDRGAEVLQADVFNASRKDIVPWKKEQ